MSKYGHHIIGKDHKTEIANVCPRYIIGFKSGEGSRDLSSRPR
jgi:hypothetical protein